MKFMNKCFKEIPEISDLVEINGPDLSDSNPNARYILHPFTKPIYQTICKDSGRSNKYSVRLKEGI